MVVEVEEEEEEISDRSKGLRQGRKWTDGVCGLNATALVTVSSINKNLSVVLTV